MPLTDEEIANLEAKYIRERDRYQKMALLVHRHLEAQLRSRHIRAVVTSRAKGAESLREKLRKDRGKHSWDELKSEFNPRLRDIAGARVMLYEFTRDNEPVARLVEELFEIPPGDNQRDIDLDKVRTYQARHRTVSLKPEQLADPQNENLKGLLCEIQIVSLVKHIWNELEHDIKYKDPEGLGHPDAEQAAWLSVLWDTLQAAETAVGHLSRVTDQRRAEKLLIAPSRRVKSSPLPWASSANGPLREMQRRFYACSR